MIDVSICWNEQCHLLLELDEHGQPNYGKLLKKRREELTWSREQLAQQYGRGLDQDIGGDAIRMMEEYNQVPKNRQRRYILAALLGIPPVLLGLPSLRQPTEDPIEGMAILRILHEPIDLAEYRATLGYYFRHGASAAGDIFGDLVGRISLLHDTLPYVNRADQQEMTRLLCGFNTVAGNIANEFGFCETADKYHEKAIFLATEHHLDDLQGFARWQRANDMRDRGDYEAALADLTQAKQLEGRLPAQLNASVSSLLAEMSAHAAQGNKDISTALRMMDEAEHAIGPGMELNAYQLQFDRERHILDKALVRVAAPVKKLHTASEAIREIEVGVSLPQETRTSAYRQSTCNIIQARAYIDKGQYEFATQLALDALAIVEELHSSAFHFDIIMLYKTLKTSRYKNATAVAELGVELMKAQHPELFAKKGFTSESQ
ncbi:MAG: hypothetical protein JO202_08665 [Ktedonobacteraceae bacterium]|nr:hypothetical protein [Ktedonobacteraceae bacterium]